MISIQNARCEFCGSKGACAVIVGDTTIENEKLVRDFLAICPDCAITAVRAVMSPKVEVGK